MEVVEPIRDKAKIQAMKEALTKPRDRFLFVLGINTALRVSDLLKLKVKDVRGQTHLVIRHEEKTGKSRKQIISQALKREIDKYTEGKEPEEWLFPSDRLRKGETEIQPIRRIQAYRILNQASEKVGLEHIGTHTLRKTFCFHYYQETMDIVTLQQLLNHSSPQITLVYAGVNQDTMDDKLKDFSL